MSYLRLRNQPIGPVSYVLQVMLRRVEHLYQRCSTLRTLRRGIHPGNITGLGTCRQRIVPCSTIEGYNTFLRSAPNGTVPARLFCPEPRKAPSNKVTKKYCFSSSSLPKFLTYPWYLPLCLLRRTSVRKLTF